MNKKWLARARLTKPKFKIRWENKRAADEKSTFECEAQIKHQIIDRISKRRQPAKCKAAAAFHPEIWTPHSNFEPSTSAQETQTKKKTQYQTQTENLKQKTSPRRANSGSQLDLKSLPLAKSCLSVSGLKMGWGRGVGKGWRWCHPHRLRAGIEPVFCFGHFANSGVVWPTRKPAKEFSS